MSSLDDEVTRSMSNEAQVPPPHDDHGRYEWWLTPLTAGLAVIVSATPGKALTFNVTNAGAMPHDFSLNGAEGTTMLESGESGESGEPEVLEVKGLDVATEAWCTVPGYEESGMVMTIGVPAAAGHGSGANADATAAPQPPTPRRSSKFASASKGAFTVSHIGTVPEAPAGPGGH